MRSMCNNTTNTTNITCSVDTSQGLAYCPLFLLGFLVNGAALRAFIAKRDSWTDTHVYIINLVIADSTLILFLPFRIFDAFFCLPKTYLCSFLLSIHYINMYASILTTAAISVHRYLAIRFPLQARSWRKKKETAFAVCLLIWSFLVIICTIYREENNPKNLWTCYERCKNSPLDAKLISIMVSLGFLSPLLIIVFCSSQIIAILLKVDDRSGEKKSTIGIVTANMVVFFICYTPIHVGFLVNYFAPLPENWHVVHTRAHLYLLVSEWIASTNCCFDSISYYFLLMKFYSKAVGAQ
ncbi:G-protein coupled receptor 35 [Dicentrarchus labrax]|uniref:G-protein coupled receptors family 1 profile domain-containing protein n=1 Tax=Dicentrarchus labrax TaxID=13489 RepID=A0A8P4G3Z4_DICLA|nr:G-protein coupled receptor 35 [Dicentrarchus labrax]